MSFSNFFFKSISSSLILFAINLSYSIFAEPDCKELQAWAKEQDDLKFYQKLLKRENTTDGPASKNTSDLKELIRGAQKNTIQAFDRFLSSLHLNHCSKQFSKNKDLCTAIHDFINWHGDILQEYIGVQPQDKASKKEYGQTQFRHREALRYQKICNDSNRSLDQGHFNGHLPFGSQFPPPQKQRGHFQGRGITQ